MPKKGELVIKGKLTGRQAAQRKYNSKPEQKKRRAQRNKTRKIMEKAGRVRKGDGKDVDHRNHNTADNTPTNLAVQDKRVNRRDGGLKALTNILLNSKRKKRAKK
jgi:hypothetical protein